MDQLTFSVRRGEIFVFLGPNGAGKTTTVRMLTSILRPTRGWARVAGYDVTKNPDEIRANVGVLTEQHGLYMRMNAIEYLDFFGQVYSLSATARKARSEHLLEYFGLTEAAHRRVGEYSKGMRQKLALARALIHEPPVLLLDEPTSSLSAHEVEVLFGVIADLKRRGVGLVYITHKFEELAPLGDDVTVLRHRQCEDQPGGGDEQPLRQQSENAGRRRSHARLGADLAGSAASASGFAIRRAL